MLRRWTHSSATDKSIFIFPVFSSLSVDKTPSSIAFKAVLASPSETSARKLTASSVITASKAPIPFSSSDMALLINTSIFSLVNGFN